MKLDLLSKTTQGRTSQKRHVVFTKLYIIYENVFYTQVFILKVFHKKFISVFIIIIFLIKKI